MNEEQKQACATLFLMTLSEEGINPNVLTAEQFSRMSGLFQAGFRAGAIYTVEQALDAIETFDREAREAVVL